MRYKLLMLINLDVRELRIQTSRRHFGLRPGSSRDLVSPFKIVFVASKAAKALWFYVSQFVFVRQGLMGLCSACLTTRKVAKQGHMHRERALFRM